MALFTSHRLIQVFQNTFSEMEYDGKKKRTRRDRLLAEIEKITPWLALLVVIAPHYPNEGGEVARRSDWSVC